MNDATPVMLLRAAAPADAPTIAAVWGAGWRESHLGRVPDALLAHRTTATFHSRAVDKISDTVVALVATGLAGAADEPTLAGFVTVIDDEVEQLYVDRRQRGHGIADALLARAESQIAERHDTAWLAVVEENGPARRFYERCGWVDRGPFDNPADVAGGTVLVPCRRYEKHVSTEQGATR